MLYDSPDLPIPARPSTLNILYDFQQWPLACIKDLVHSHQPSHSRAPALGCGIVQACAGPWSFGSVAEYAAFLRPRLRLTTRLVAVAGERKGDRGTFLESDNSISPCQVQWDAFGKPFWVRWSDVALEVYYQTPLNPPSARPASCR
jgi:hypothetical protein